MSHQEVVRMNREISIVDAHTLTTHAQALKTTATRR